MNNAVLITGASSGLGIEFAKCFAKDGFDIVLVARNERKLNKLATALSLYYGINTYVCVQDLSEKNAAVKVRKFTEDLDLNILYMVNNAGFGDCGDFADCDWQKQYEMINVNILALMQLCRVYIPKMRETGYGKILNIASAAAFAPGPGMSAYYASKAFVKSFSEAICEEVKGNGITVTALCLGPADTGFWDAAGSAEKSFIRRGLMANAKDVAKTGYEAMFEGKALSYFGLTTKAGNLGSRLLPSALVRKVIHKINS